MNTSKIASRTIEALRFPCAVLIVLIHVFQVRPETGLSRFSLSYAVQILLSQGIARIAVPVFFLISGYLFFSKLDRWDWGAYFQKLKKRVRTLLVPYLLWVTLAFLVEFIIALFRGSSPVELLSNYGWGLIYWNCGRYFVSFEKNVLGWAIPSAYPFDFPLWFVRDLIVLCLLAPVIHFLIRKTRGWILAVLYPLYLLQIWIPLEGFSAEGFFFFSLGSTLRIYGKDIVEVFRKFRLPAYIVSAIALFLCLWSYGDSVGSRIMDVRPLAYEIRLLTLPGAVAAFNIVSALLEKGIWKDNAFLAECSFPIFAAHTIRLPFLTGFVLEKLIPGASGMASLARYLIQPALIIGIIILAFLLAKRILPRTTALFTGYRTGLKSV